MPLPKLSLNVLTLSVLTMVLHGVVAIAQYHFAFGSAGVGGVLLYYAAVTALLGCYAAVVAAVDETPTSSRWALLVAVPLIVQIGWVLMLPALSIDAYSYLVDAAHAYAGASPYRHGVNEAAGTDLGRALIAYGWRPVHGVTPYGPLWLDLVRLVGPFASHVGVAVRIVKLLAVAATAATAALILRVSPESYRVRAFTMFWWNPAVIIEAAGEGHNDTVMMLAVVLSLWCLRRRAVAAAAVALSAAVLTKWVPAAFAPAYLVYAWRNHLLTRRNVIAAAAAMCVVGIAAYWPVWAGADSLAGMRRLGGPRFVASTTGSVVRLLASRPTAYTTLLASVLAAMVMVTVWAAASTRSIHDLITACAATIIVYLLVSAPMFWAWYVLLPIALLAMSNAFPLVVVLTATSRLVAPLDAIRVRGGLSWTTEVWVTTVVALWVPLLYIVWQTRTSWLVALRPSRPAGERAAIV